MVKIVFSGGSDGKESACNAGDRGSRFSRKSPWRRARQPTPVFLPVEFRGQRSLVGYSPWSRRQLDTTEWLTHKRRLLWWEQSSPTIMLLFIIFFFFFTFLIRGFLVYSLKGPADQTKVLFGLSVPILSCTWHLLINLSKESCQALLQGTEIFQDWNCHIHLLNPRVQRGRKWNLALHIFPHRHTPNSP